MTIKHYYRDFMYGNEKQNKAVISLLYYVPTFTKLSHFGKYWQVCVFVCFHYSMWPWKSNSGDAVEVEQEPH